MPTVFALKKYKSNNNNQYLHVRQDNIELFQIILNKDKTEIKNKIINIDNKLWKLKFENKNNKINSIERFYNNQIYISQLIFESEIINDEVMFKIKKIIQPLIDSKVINEFRSAPIKKLERCIEKTETDYMNESFPQSSKLIDIIRCSLSFSSLK